MPPGPAAFLRVGLAVLLALGAALVFDRLCVARGLQPPGFRVLWRRALALAALTGLFALGVFAPLASLGLSLEPDVSKISTPQLFLLHVLMLATLGIWFLLGFAGRGAQPLPAPLPAPAMEPLPPELAPPPSVPPPPPRVPLGRQFLAQLGLRAPRISNEIGLGLALGIAAWLAVLLAVIAVAGVLWAVGGEKAIPKQPPALIPFIAGLPFGIRLLISLSAGFVEEGFFRGFLQPRIGIGLSTAFFALAHLSYGQPFLLVGVTLLSLIYALLVKWRQNIWPAIAAHALFDSVQLLVLVPLALRFLQGAGGKAAAFLW
jgi:membrane protease YdiL (CAAX protease family)